MDEREGESTGLGERVGGRYPECGFIGWVGGEGRDGRVEGEIQAVALSHPTMLAIVHERAEPWRTPQSKEFMHVPNGVFVWILTSDRDSAIHSV